VSPGVSQVSLRCLLVSFSVIGASSFPPGDSFGKVTAATQYAPDLPQLHRILSIPNVHFFTFFPDVATIFLAPSKIYSISNSQDVSMQLRFQRLELMSFLRLVLLSRQRTRERGHGFPSTPHMAYIKSWML